MNEAFQQKFILVQRVYRTLVAGVLLYGVIAYAAIYFGDTTISKQGGILKYVLFGISLIAVMMIVPVQKYILSLSVTGSETEQEKLDRLQKMHMYTLGLCEIPAFLGLVSAVLVHQMSLFFIFLVLTYASLYRHRPQESEWTAYLHGTSD